MEYDEAERTYYCPKCEKHWNPLEVEEKKTMYQDTTTGNEPPDKNELEEEAEEAKKGINPKTPIFFNSSYNRVNNSKNQ